MRIDQLRVVNFRRFEESTFEFHRQFTLLRGRLTEQERRQF